MKPFSIRSLVAFAALTLFLPRAGWREGGGSAEVADAEEKVVIERDPLPYETPYTPTDGQRLSVTPATFLWLPVKGQQEYVLQYGQDPALADPAKTTTVSVTRTIYVPRQVLAPGRWHWRYGIKGASGSVFSRTRSFEIPPDAVRMPFPDVKEIVRKLAASHPRVEVTAAELPAVRERAKKELKATADSMVQSALSYARQDLLPEPAFLPDRKDPNRSAIYTKTFRTTRPFNSGMNHCAATYLVTGDEQAGQEARRRLMHLIGWDPNGSTCLFHNDEPGTELVRLCPRAYDWIYPLLTEEERKKCREVLAVRMRQLYDALSKKPFECMPYDSHAMGYYLPDLIEACVAMAGDLPVEEYLEYCLTLLWSPYYPPFGGDDGGWSEGPAYWGWSTYVFVRTFEIVQKATGVPLAQRPNVRNAGYYKLYDNPPYSKMSPFGDGQSGPPSGANTMYRLGLLFRDPHFLWYAQQMNYKPYGIEAFVCDPNGLRPAPPSDLPQARCFFDVGLAAMHSDLGDAARNVQFLMRSSPFGSTSHSYADQNAFALHAFGEPLAIASGYYPYYASPHHKAWTWETRAANCITVDGQGQKIRDWNSRGQITRFVTNDYAHYALGDATPAYEGRLSRFHRHVVFLRPSGGDPEEALVVLFDDLQAAKPSTFQWLLHALEKMDVDAAGQQATLHRGNARLKAVFLAPAGLHFEQTDQFTVPPEREKPDQFPNQWHLTASVEPPVSACRFLTVLMPYPADKESSLPTIRRLEGQGCEVVEVRTAQGRHVVLFRTDGKKDSEISAGGVKTTGDVLAVGLRADGSCRGFLETASVPGGSVLALQPDGDHAAPDNGEAKSIQIARRSPMSERDDCFYPSEEDNERQAAVPPRLVSIQGDKAVLQDAGAQKEVGVDSMIGDWRLVAVLPDDGGVAVLERDFDRWGIIAYVKTSGVLATIRKSIGRLDGIAERVPAFPKDYFDKLMANQEDVLGQQVLAEQGDPSYAKVLPGLAPLKSYAFIGTPDAKEKPIVFQDGRIGSFSGKWGKKDLEKVFFDPYASMPGLKPKLSKQGTLGGWLPAVDLGFYDPDTKSGFEEMAFVTNRARVARVRKADGASEYFQFTDQARPGDRNEFYRDLLGLSREWEVFFSCGMSIRVPEPRIEDACRASIIRSLITYVGPHPKYGHGAYGRDEHDSFPPTTISMGRCLLEWGYFDKAKELLGYFLSKLVKEDGTIAYYGPAVSEYGQVLEVVATCTRRTGDRDWLRTHRASIDRLCNHVLTEREASKQKNAKDSLGYGLIWGSPEADTRDQRNFYFSGDAWCWRGLLELGRLYAELGRASSDGAMAERGKALIKEAEAYREDIMKSIGRSILSNCAPPFLPPVAGFDKPFPTMTADTFASYTNYRYWLEMISAGLLDDELTDMIITYRTARGGELLGMTRFAGQLDDWPYGDYAYGILARDRVAHYLLGYYAHMAHHVTRGTFTAYEQVPIRGAESRDFVADHCVPSQLVTPLMTRWMLVFEERDADVVWLNRAAPRGWHEDGKTIEVKGAPTRWGSVGYQVVSSVGSGSIRATIELPSDPFLPSIRLRLRAPGRARMKTVEVDGKPWTTFDRQTEIIHLPSRLEGKVEVVARL